MKVNLKIIILSFSHLMSIFTKCKPSCQTFCLHYDFPRFLKRYWYDNNTLSIAYRKILLSFSVNIVINGLYNGKWVANINKLEFQKRNTCINIHCKRVKCPWMSTDLIIEYHQGYQGNISILNFWLQIFDVMKFLHFLTCFKTISINHCMLKGDCNHSFRWHFSFNVLWYNYCQVW